MNKEELITVVGGALTSTMLNAIARAVTFALEVGRSLGSSIRRALADKKCSL